MCGGGVTARYRAYETAWSQFLRRPAPAAAASPQGIYFYEHGSEEPGLPSVPVYRSASIYNK